MDSLLNNLETDGNEEAVQETLGEIKKHLIAHAHDHASRSVLRSQEFFKFANS